MKWKRHWKEKGNEIKVEIKKTFLQGIRNVATRKKWNKIEMKNKGWKEKCKIKVEIKKNLKQNKKMKWTRNYNPSSSELN